VHPKSFGGIYPSEPKMNHILDPRYTVIEYDTGEDPRLDVWQGRIARWLGTEPTNVHVHRHIHPHTILVTSSLFSYIVNYLPVSPRLTRVRLRMYSYRGTKSNPWARYLAWLLAIFSKRTMRRIMLEDLGIFTDQQRGLEVSGHKGVIGTREERIYVFHRWWMDRMGREIGRGGEEFGMPFEHIEPGDLRTAPADRDENGEEHRRENRAEDSASAVSRSSAS
jgi:hypothetical protein